MNGELIANKIIRLIDDASARHVACGMTDHYGTVTTYHYLHVENIKNTEAVAAVATMPSALALEFADWLRLLLLLLPLPRSNQTADC